MCYCDVQTNNANKIYNYEQCQQSSRDFAKKVLVIKLDPPKDFEKSTRLVITNDSLHETKPGVIRYDDKLSDHYVIYCNATNNSVTSPKQTYFTIRDKSTFNADSYRDEMNTAVYDYLSNLGELTELNFDRTFDEFVSLVQNVMEKHAPLKRLSRKQQKLKSKPWITKEIYAMICRKNKMHKSHYILGNEAMKQEYKSYSNKLTKIKALAKKEYYSAEIEKNKTNQRKTWELLRILLPGNSKKRNILPTTINVDNVTVTDQQRSLDEFNQFFSKVGENLASEFSTNDEAAFELFLQNRVSHGTISSK